MDNKLVKLLDGHNDPLSPPTEALWLLLEIIYSTQLNSTLLLLLLLRRQRLYFPSSLI